MQIVDLLVILRSVSVKSFVFTARLPLLPLFGGRGEILCLAAALIFTAIGFNAAWGAEVCQHDLKVELQPEAHRLIGQDDIRVEGWKGGEISLLLSDKANIKSVLVNEKPSKYSFSSGKLTFPALSALDGKPLLISISYDAVFNDPVVSEPATFDNPGFGVTGSIGERGTFLLEDSGWYPRFLGCSPAGPVAGLPACKIAACGRSERFNLEVGAPRGIYVVTAGELIGHEDRDSISISSWKITPIGQGISLSAGRYIVRSKKDGKIPIYTYFTSENDSLSETYLNAAASHIEFYESLHGPYPFPKFAIVENFFPTGYGFPSYTLLGGSVLRLPFIPQTSLRHEIAHSWWGNGVLVDYDSGNWCEGLTTYVADYLSQEKAAAGGSGASLPADPRLYRQQILQEYATLAASGADLPLRLFGARSSPATRAVGYGKAAFVFHMIRQKLGDRVFWDCLRQICKERLFVRTSWDDFRDIFVRIGGWDAREAKVFFDQWIGRSGAPVLKLQDVQSRPGGTDASGWRTTGSLLQGVPWYDLDITVALTTSQDERVDTKIGIKDGSASFSIRSAEAPRKLIVDPDVNTFRLLYPEEIPAAVNSVKGSTNLLAVLAEDGGLKMEHGRQWQRAAFELLLEGLDQADVPIIGEKEAEAKLSKENGFLFFGLPKSEKLKSLFASAPEEVKRRTREDRWRKTEEGSEADCLFLVFKDPNGGGGITGLFLPASAATPDSVMTAVRKVTHYGKYGYLTFSHGAIREKGVWEVFHSPLEFDFLRR
jgi:hypothetical protein